jgi:SAM-dependent methyltransferase
VSQNSPSWDQRYGADEYYYGKEPNDFLRGHARLIAPGGRVLCLAEGEGRNAVFLASLGHFVTAVDGSRAGLEKTAKLALERGVGVGSVHADLSDYRIEPESWDAIVSIWCHVPPELRARLHAAAALGLKPGGVFIFEAYHPRQLALGTGGPSRADLMVAADDLRRELAGLDLEILREIERDVREGRGHNGRSAVVQAVARKTKAFA